VVVDILGEAFQRAVTSPADQDIVAGIVDLSRRIGDRKIGEVLAVLGPQFVNVAEQIGSSSTETLSAMARLSR